MTAAPYADLVGNPEVIHFRLSLPTAAFASLSGFCGSIDSLTRALALELAPIRVNAVAPGVVRTEFWNDMSEEEGAVL